MPESFECYHRHCIECEQEGCQCSCHVNRENPYWLTLFEK